MGTNWKELLNHIVLARVMGRNGFGPLEEYTVERVSPAGFILLRLSRYDHDLVAGSWYAPHELSLEEDLGENPQPVAK